VKIKICGLTRVEDVELISRSGADYAGLLINMPSKRTLDLETAVEFSKICKIDTVLLFMNSEIEFVIRAVDVIKPFGVQLQGAETPEYIVKMKKEIECEIWKGVHLPADGIINQRQVLDVMNDYAESGANIILLDTVVTGEAGKQFGGTGRTYDWDEAKNIVQASPLPVMIAGGLNPDNVSEAICKLKPFGVDLASGVESRKGIKDPEKVRRFVLNVRNTNV